MKARVEFDHKPIRHIAIQCPNCEKWFKSYDITKDELCYEYDLYSVSCDCPSCGHMFKERCEVEEVGYPEIYKGVLKKKVTWE